MPLLHLDALPPKTTKGTLVRLVTQVGGLERGKIGAISIHGRAAAIEVPERWLGRLVKALDGASLGQKNIRAWHDLLSLANVSDGDHFAHLAALLEVEAAAEAAETQRQFKQLTPVEAERAGHSLIDLVVAEQSAGLGGRCLVVLRKRDLTRPLPWTRLNVGSPVLVSVQDASESGLRGVISRRLEQAVEVALSQPIPAETAADRYRVDHSSDEISRRRQRAALERARSARGDRLAVLRSVLLGEQPPGMRQRETLTGLDRQLDRSQVEAVEVALAAEDVAIIHGPPGTGKTTAVVELIRQAVKRGEKVLACAPSNLAVDNVIERLAAAGERAIRLGHPARVMPELRERTLDLIVQNHPDIKLAKKLTQEAHALFEKSGKYTRARPAPGSKRELREAAKLALDDARRIESQVVQEVLDSADVLCATLTGIDSDVLGQRQFDLLVIDEACQTTEPPCWIPLSRCHRVVLAGDHCQLPPTVISQDAARDGLAISLLERLMQGGSPPVSRQLQVQYRMHREIMDFSSAEFYESSLIADETVADHRLFHLPQVAENELTRRAIEFIDTAGAGYDDEVEESGRSHLNRSEAELAVAQVEALTAAGLPGRDIAVIAPYAAQVRHLREFCGELSTEIDTVDGFQGREKEAVIISLVRSNSKGEIGFLADTRRMNVALTRARRKLIVIGDSSTVARHAFYSRLVEYFEAIGAYRTVWELER